MPRPGGRHVAEKPKDFFLTLKRIISKLNKWSYILIFALVLAMISAILALVAPNKLSDLADEIQKGIVPKTENIEFCFDSKVAELLGDDRLSGVKVENVISGEKSEILLDGLFISIGRTPKTELFEGQLNLDESGYIIADETTKTNLSGVYAAGDIRTKALRQIVTAAADGAVAAFYAEQYLAEIK